MGEFLNFSKHLTPAAFDSPIRSTYIGQAHIAGTTCRECVFWRKKGFRKQDGEWAEFTKAPEYFGKGHTKTPCELKKQYCTKPILNKAKRLIPHAAKSCRLFEAAGSPPPAKKAAEGQ